MWVLFQHCLRGPTAYRSPESSTSRGQHAAGTNHPSTQHSQAGGELQPILGPGQSCTKSKRGHSLLNAYKNFIYSTIVSHQICARHCSKHFTQIQLALCIHRFCILRFNHCESKIFRKKFSESSKKQNSNLPCVSNYLRSIYIVLGIISNLEMI